MTSAASYESLYVLITPYEVNALVSLSKSKFGTMADSGVDRLTMSADHLDNEPACCFVWLILNMAFAPLDRRILALGVTLAAFEHRE